MAGAENAKPSKTIHDPHVSPADHTDESAPGYARSGDEEPFDPVKANGEIFVGWEKPSLLFFLTGEQNGYLEPCGCAGLENMKGGLMRRHTLVEQLRARGWPVVALDAGGLVRRFGKQAELKYAASVESLQRIGYDAIAFGPRDLRLGADALLPLLAEEDHRFLATNATLLIPVATHKIVQRGGYKIGVVATLGKAAQAEADDGTVQFAEAAAAIEGTLPKLEDCDLKVLLSHGTLDEGLDLARRFGQFDVVATTGGADMPPHEPHRIQGTLVVELGRKGMYAGALGLYLEGRKGWKFQRVPIDSRFEDSPKIKEVLVDLQDQYKLLGWGGLGIKPLPHPSGWTYVGSQKCGECHTQAMEVFENTPHAHATESIVKLDPPRQFDPECVSCHVTGWEPQKYFPFAGGFDSLQATAHLRANGCENCHGPGSRHVGIEEGEIDVDSAEQLRVRGEMRLTLKEARDRACAQCHDLDNSPDYVKKGFEAYWPHVEHKGKY